MTSLECSGNPGGEGGGGEGGVGEGGGEEGDEENSVTRLKLMGRVTIYVIF